MIKDKLELENNKNTKIERFKVHKLKFKLDFFFNHFTPHL